MSRSAGSLHGILESVLDAHRRDIHTFSGGHLNESNLFKPVNPSSKKVTWQNASKPAPTLLPKSTLTHSPRVDKHESRMKDTMIDFSLGTSRAPLKPSDRARASKSFVLKKQDHAEDNEEVSDESNLSLYSQLNDGVLIEELKATDAMLTRSDNYITKGWVREDFKSQKRLKPLSLGLKKDENLLRMSTHQFFPSHLESVTKKDQFSKLKKFENRILRKQDASEQQVLSGVRAVEHLEAKLKQDLDNLPYDGYGPNFHRLQIYSNTFDDLITDSPTFGYILKVIKKEYDSYVSSLLDSQRDKHKVLYSQVEQLSSRGTSNPEMLHHEVRTVNILQATAREKLAENERLREVLKHERDLESEPVRDVPTPKKITSYREEPEMEIADKIEQLHTSILEKMDAMKELKGKLRRDYVPLSVVQHLEQCIKETEVEIQKLTSSKEYYERSINEMERDLQEAIEDADTTERDAKRVWRRVSAVKNAKRGSQSNADVEDTESEEDDSKWNWYIS